MHTDDQTTDHENSFIELSTDWLFDEMSESRAVPAYWDLSELTSNNGYSQGKTSDPPEPVGSLPAQQSELRKAQQGSSGADDGLPECYRNPFPEPRTFPVYWDLFK